MAQIVYFNQFYVIKMAKTKVKELMLYVFLHSYQLGIDTFAHEYKWATTNIFGQPMQSSRPFPFGKTLKSGKQKQKNFTYLPKIRTVTVWYDVQAASAHGGVKYSPPMM